MRPIVAYHKNCPDGFGGAFAAWKVLGDSAEYIGLEHHLEPPKAFRDRIIYFIDFCYKEDPMQKLVVVNERIIVLDHHATQESAARLAHECHYDISHSGSVIAWNYFHPHTPLPHLLAIVEDNDLFRRSLPSVNELSQVIALRPFDFGAWDALREDLEDPDRRAAHIRDGTLLLAARTRAVDTLVERAEPVEFEGYAVFAVNTSRLYSETANAIYNRLGCPFGLTWYYQDGWIHVSLRSNGVIDVSVLAQKYKGGGHRGAAGFSIPFSYNFPWKFDPARANSFTPSSSVTL